MARFACLTLLLAVGGCSIGRVVVNGRGELAFPVEEAIVVSKPEADPVRTFRLRLGDPHVCQPLLLEWDPAGRWIAFSYARHRDGPDAGGIGVLDTATGACHSLLDVKFPREYEPLAWSPDGTCLAVLREGRLLAVELDEERRERTRRLLAEGCVGLAWISADRVVAAVRDHKSVALKVCGRDGSEQGVLTRDLAKTNDYVGLEVRGLHLFAGPVRTGVVRIHLGTKRVTHLDLGKTEPGWFSVSPSGDRVAFLQMTGKVEDGNLEVGVADTADWAGTARILTCGLPEDSIVILPFWVGDERLGYTDGERRVLLDLRTDRVFPMDHLLHAIWIHEEQDGSSSVSDARLLETLAQRLPRGLPRPLPVALEVEAIGRLPHLIPADEVRRMFLRRLRDTPALWIACPPGQPEDGELPYRHVLRVRTGTADDKFTIACELVDLRRPAEPVATAKWP